MKDFPITCVICAYKESPFLKECILSLVHQTVSPHILISTSTPNSFIFSLAKSYHIPVHVNPGPGTMQDNFNFAYQQAKTPYVTICHQDDVYEKTYIEHLLKYIQADKNNEIILLHTRWKVLKNGQKQENRCSRIHWMLNTLFQFFPSTRWLRICMLSLGNSIKTPSICYNKKHCPEPLFNSSYQFAFDWDNIMKLAKRPGKFMYIEFPAFLYRISNKAQTFLAIKDNQRSQEDLKIFCSLWPLPVAHVIAKIYKLAYGVYE